MHELDIDKRTKQMWDSLKVKSGGMTRIRKARVQSLKRDYKNLFMGEDDLFLYFFGKLSCTVTELRSLGELITDVEVTAKLQQSISSKFDAITTFIKKFRDREMITLEEVIGTLKVHEDKIKTRSAKREDKALLAKAFIKDKVYDFSNGRGHGRGCGKGRDRNKNKSNEDGEDKKTQR